MKSDSSAMAGKSTIYDRRLALGKHMTVEYYECDSEILADPVQVERAFLLAAEKSGATVLGSDFHVFEPQGVSGVVVISESHLAVHAWPEHDYAAVDIFTCGDTIDFQAAVDSLKESLKSEEVIISSLMNRGIVGNNGIEKLIPVFEDKTHLYALSWKQKFEKSQAWGISTSLDIYGCDAAKIRCDQTIKRFVAELCDRIEMKRFGECNVVHFGEDDQVAGFSMTQLIETSLVSGHFAEASNHAYLDIFSCKFYEPREAAEFAVEFFNAENYRMQVALRR